MRVWNVAPAHALHGGEDGREEGPQHRHSEEDGQARSAHRLPERRGLTFRETDHQSRVDDEEVGHDEDRGGSLEGPHGQHECSQVRIEGEPQNRNGREEGGAKEE